MVAPDEDGCGHRAGDENAAQSTLDDWFDVCRVGAWTDTTGDDVSLDEDRLDRIVAAHALADLPPVVVGHPGSDAPASAWVEGLRRLGDRLQAMLCDVRPAFRAAVEAGRYGALSVALQGDRLVCIGFVEESEASLPAPGSAQPEEETRAPIPCSAQAPPGNAEERDAWRAAARTMRRLHERTLEADARPPADTLSPENHADTVAAAAGAPAGTEGPPSRQPPPNPELLVLGGAPPDFRQEAATAEGGAAAIAAAIRWHRIRELIDGHVRAGRVLASERTRLMALLASLPDDEGSAIAYAAPDGSDTEIHEAPASILERFLAMLPRRTHLCPPDALAMPKATGGDGLAVAAEARSLMAEQAGKGVIISFRWAKEQVRAKRGLSTIRGAR